MPGSMRALSLALGAIVFGACSFDVELPPDPVRGSVRGTLDPSSASPFVSPMGHTVKLTHVNGGSVTQVSAADGSFTFSDLQVGGWILEVRVAGFAPEVVTGIQVSSGRETDLGA